MCYEQVDVVGQGFEWKQFDCIAYLENAFFDQEILNILFSYYQSTSSAKMPKAAFGEIAEEAMHSKYSREFYNRKTILENLHRNIRDILQKYSGHKTD